MQDNCFLDFIDPELYYDSTKMSQGRNDDKESPQNFTNAMKDKMCKGSKKTQSLFSSARIYEVPEDLRKLNKSAYTPRVIAIGPLHRKDEHLQTYMQSVKWYYTHYLLNRLTKGIGDKEQKQTKLSDKLQECAEKMKEKECVDKAKDYYAAEVTVDDEMSEMLLVDGCFILELLYASHSKKTEEAEKMTTNGADSSNKLKASCSAPQPNGGEDSSKSSAGGRKKMVDPLYNLLTYNNVKHDLLLLENQIPFFVLEELFKLTVEQIHGDHFMGCTCKLSLSDYVLSYFQEIMDPEGENNGRATRTSCSCSPRDTILGVYNKITCTKTEVEQEEKVPEKPNESYYHILHLLYSKYIPVDQKKLCGIEQNSSKFSDSMLPAASDLEHLGVKFVPGKGTNLFNVKFKVDKAITWWFHRAEFEIPTLCIHDPTEPFLRNLIAFEQCCPEVLQYFTSYAKLMGMLINSVKDVKVLKKAKVIHSYWGADEDVSGLFNKLCKEVVIREFYFNGECKKASKYSDLCWPQFVAYWVSTFSASPWAFAGFSVAFAAFVLQVISFARDFHT